MLAIYLHNSGLDLYSDGSSGIAYLKFPPTLVDNQEILDQNKFEKLLENFFSGMDLKKNQAVIALSEKIIFRKQISATNLEAEKEETEKFIEEIPFESKKIALMKLKDQDELSLIATNKHLFSSLRSVLERLGGKVLIVAPATAIFGDIQKDNLEIDDFKNLMKNFSRSKNINFLTDSQQVGREPSLEDQPAKSHNTLLWLTVSLGCFLVAGLLLSYSFGIIKDPRDKTIPLPSPTPTLVQVNSAALSNTVTESSKTATVRPAELKVQIINGTGVAGQAAKTKELLGKLGFTDFDLGNSEGSKSAQTVVLFSSKVSSKTQSEVISELQKTFAKVSTPSSQINSSYDLQITTGEYTKEQ